MRQEAEIVKCRLDDAINKKVTALSPMYFYKKRIKLKIYMDECPITQKENNEICKYLTEKWL